MLTKPPLVPSKDALRLLRQLAFAGSTLAAIGVVTINYNVHRRIRLAEKCLETKRQIRALSNGTGKAHLARIIEAAENGQDFSIRAMREQRIKERRFKPTIPSRSANEVTREEGLGRLGMPHDDVGSYLKREKTTQKIKRATVGMTSTAPVHVYGRPKRFEKPTASWPTVGGEDYEKLETSVRPTSNESTRNNAEAAEKIKRATMAMTSTAPAHVYGRPKQAVPKARVNLHGTVASWLETAPASTEKWHAGTTVETLPEQDDRKKSSDIGSVEPLLDQSDPSAAESETTRGSATTAGTSHGSATTVEHHEEEQTFGLSQNDSNRGSEDEINSRSDEETQLMSTSHDMPLVNPAMDPPALTKDFTPQDAINTGSNAASVSSISDGMSEVNMNDGDSSPKSCDYDPQTAAEVEAELLLSSQQMVAVDSQGHGAGGKHNQGTGQPAPQPGPTAGGPNPSSALQPHNQIQLQFKTDQDGSTFMSWPHLHSLDDSHLFFEDENHDLHSMEEQMTEEEQMAEEEQVAEEEQMQEEEQITEEEQRMSEDVQTETRFDEEDQLRRTWTPFPRESRATEAATGKRHHSQDYLEHLELGRASWLARLREESRNPKNVWDLSQTEASVVDAMTAEERAKLALRIHNTFASHGFLNGQKAWYTAAYSRMDCNDLTALDFLYAEFVGRGVLSVPPRHYIVQTLVQWHYQRSKYSARAAEILFPDPELDWQNTSKAEQGSVDRYFATQKEGLANSVFAIRFFQGLWEVRADPDWLMFNLRRLIVAAKLRGVKLVQELFAIVIRSLASIGDMGSAQAVYDEMIFYHQIEPSFLSRTLLLRGYAGLGDWRRVEIEIVFLHDQGLSRSKPYGYAHMIDAVLREYAARTSVEQFQNFLINAISYWGLVPTSSISMTAVQAYLSHKRYDLVREWMETLQALFPQIETETSSFRWSLGHFWQRTGATCQDIEEAIKAVAYRNPRTKLKSHAIPLIHEALFRDLDVKLGAAKSKTDPDTLTSVSSSDGENIFSGTRTLDEYLSSAYTLIASNISPNQKLTPEVVELHRQASAVERINAFLTDKTSSEAVSQICFPNLDTTSANTNTIWTPASSTLTIAHLKDTIPTILTTESLPETSLIVVAIIDCYRTRYTLDLPTDHVLLRWVCEKLLHTGRAVDALFVLDKIYRHSFVQDLISPDMKERHGTGGRAAQGPTSGFPIHFFELWMRLASATRSMLQWKRVVEQVLIHSRPRPTFPATDATAGLEKKTTTATNPLKITASFVSLTRLVAAKGMRVRWTRSRPQRRGMRGPMAEVLWLTRAVEKRREAQIGRREGKGESVSKLRAPRL